MKHDLPALESLKVFEAAARLLSFSRAADELCITKAAVSYQIRKLENELDCSLFRRSVRQVYLTDAGQELLQGTQQLFSGFETVLERIKPRERQANVVIGATTYVAMRWLSRHIVDFNTSYPSVSVVLHHAVNSNDFRIQDVDFAVRWDQLEVVPHRSRLLQVPMPLFPACSADLWQRLPAVDRQHGLRREDLLLDGFADVPLLCEDRPQDLWAAWMEGVSIDLSNSRRIIADANVRTQAAVDGLGWTLADDLMRREFDSGQLVAPFRHQLSGYGYVLESAPGRFLSQDARRLRDWLVSRLSSG